MPEVSGGELLVRCLLEERVKYVFGVPGAQWLPFLDALKVYGEPRGLKFVLARHEQAAGHMADAWARATGEPGVCLGTVGPGAVDLVPGVYPAWADGIPVVVLTAQNQSWRIYPDHGSTQGCDQLGVFRGVVKWSAVVSHWSRIPELVQRAFRAATSGRPGPVHLDFPVDVLFERRDLSEVRVVPRERYRATRGPAGDPELVKAAARLLAEAERPLIHAGMGVLASGAWSELAELAEFLKAPVTTTLGARGAIPEDHPLCLLPASYGALAAQAMADVVLAIGTRFGDLDFWGKPPAWGEPEAQKLIQVDIDPESIALNREVDLPIVGDAKTVLRQLIHELRQLTEGREENPYLEEYKAAEREWLSRVEELASSSSKPIHPLRLMKEAREFFPRGSITCVDGGNTAVWAYYVNRVYEPRSFLWAADSGHLGTGLPYAIAAKLAHPEKQVYLITGDGALMFNIQELETARRLNLPITVVVANDRAYGMIKGGQKAYFSERYIGVDFYDTRYDKVAEAMGCYGERVEEPEEIKPALGRALESKLPALLDVVVDREANLTPPDLEAIVSIWLEGCI